MTCKQCKYITVCMAQADGFGQVFDPNYDGEHGCTDFAPFTNADRIRSMSDDELNDLFYEIYNAGVEDASSYEWGQRTNSFEWTMDWLQMPTETQKEG